MLLLSHPTGNANLRSIAAGFHREGQLASFHTSIATFKGNFWDKVSGLPGMKDFERRRFADELRDLTVQHPFREIGRMIAKRGILTRLADHETGSFSVDGVYRFLDRKVAAELQRNPERYRAAYAYEDGALATFTAAKKAGIKCIYDLPIAYWEMKNQLMREEAERLPEWAKTLGGSVKDSKEKLERKTRELELADIVVRPGFLCYGLSSNLGRRHPPP